MNIGELSERSPSSGEEIMIRTGPFIELGKMKITISVVDDSGENTVTTSFTGWAFGYLVFLAPYR